jgi:hypothetical protein
VRVVDESLLDRARRRRSAALELVDDLDLFARWSQIGRVVLVGAVAYDLVVSPDIDIEVFTHGTPQIRDAFRVLAEVAEHPRVTKVRFTNALSSVDQGLYSQVRCYDDNGQEWKVDVWTLDESHPGPLSSALIAPMRGPPSRRGNDRNDTCNSTTLPGRLSRAMPSATSLVVTRRLAAAIPQCSPNRCPSRTCIARSGVAMRAHSAAMASAR